MPQVINMNIASMNAQRNLNQSQSALQTSLQRLSSGLRINSAKDDAAGLAITERFTSQIRGLNQAARNANDAISLSQTAEGALGEISNNLQRIRELAVQSANATNGGSDRAALQNEVSQLVSEIDRVATHTAFNGVNLLDGTFTSQAFQVGANAGQTISISSISSSRTTDLGQSYSASRTSTAVTAALGSGDISVNGVSVGASQAYAGNGQTADSAYSVALAINQAQNTVTASANATTVAGTVAGNGAIAANAFQINGVNVGAVADGTTNAGQATNVVNAINAISAASGVTASRNVAITGTVTNTGLTAATTRGTVSLNTTSQSGITIAGAGVANAGLTATTTAASLSGTAVSNISVATSSGAATAITSVDAALATVSSARATLGAYQNRFTSTIANLQTAAENLSASRSRIQDADFAAESAQLTRGQILQQAGTAMLAQANALPNNVLSLLRG
jgi:flagellin